MKELKTYQKRCIASLKRSDTEAQIAWLQKREDINSFETLITLERKFFIGRKTALKLIDEA